MNYELRAAFPSHVVHVTANIQWVKKEMTFYIVLSKADSYFQLNVLFAIINWNANDNK